MITKYLSQYEEGVWDGRKECAEEVEQLRKERDELTAIRASLSQRNAELWERDRNCFAQLAATEALLATYREALEKVLTWGNTGIPVFDVQNVIEKALATPSPTAALPSPKAALNAAIAEELDQMADVVLNYNYSTVDTLKALFARAKELRG